MADRYYVKFECVRKILSSMFWHYGHHTVNTSDYTSDDTSDDTNDMARPRKYIKKARSLEGGAGAPREVYHAYVNFVRERKGAGAHLDH